MATPVASDDRVLWRIAELGACCSDPKWRGDRRRAMAELESAIRTVADRMAGVAADTAATEAAAAGADTRVAHAERTLAERDQARAALTAAHTERDQARAALTAAHAQRDEARAALAVAEHAREISERRQALAWDAVRTWRAAPAPVDPPAEEDDAGHETERAQADDEASEEEDDEAAHEEAPPAAHEEAPPAAHAAGAARFLHVGATPGNLLPEDLEAHLIPGARVVRREGRLAALLAVLPAPAETPRHTTEREQDQADRLRARGLRVEFSSTCLAS